MTKNINGKTPLVSIVVPTKNSQEFLAACLHSIQYQSYTNIELIVVDNFSTDKTKHIAKRFTPHVYEKGPERTAQRNYAASKATGEYIMFIDSDMELGEDVVAQCVEVLQNQPEVSGIVIHEESFGCNFWARCKALERSFYVNVPWIEAARCFRTSTFRELGGYDESLVSGEDWDLSRRAEKAGVIATVDEFIRHNEGHLRLGMTLKKKYYYARHAAAFFRQNPEYHFSNAQVGPLNRYRLFLSQPTKLFHNPTLGVTMLILKTVEFAVGGIGYFKPLSN